MQGRNDIRASTRVNNANPRGANPEAWLDPEKSVMRAAGARTVFSAIPLEYLTPLTPTRFPRTDTAPQTRASYFVQPGTTTSAPSIA